MLWRRILILFATVVVLLLTTHLYLNLSMVREIDQLSGDWPQDTNIFAGKNLLLPNTDQAEGVYPFVWQKTQRDRLRSLLQLPQQMPTGSDEIALARFVQYAEKHPDETILREGMRREPHNALYHYLLADLYLAQSLRGYGPKTDKKTGVTTYEYTITDRQKLDIAMREMAIGLMMPLHSHRGALLRAQLDAMPPTRDVEGRIKEIAVHAFMLFPELAKLRNLARVNGFYLSLLLKEGKRAEAEPFLHTGEHLVVQVSNDEPSSLIGELVALALGNIALKNDAHVCRSFGLTREASMIEAHQQLLIGKLQQWKDHGRLLHKREQQTLIDQYAGILPGILLPVIGTQPEGVITKETLRPSRMAEYMFFEGGVATLLSLFSFMLLLFAALKYWRWKLATRGTAMPTNDIDFTSQDWLRILCYGLLAPLGLYLLYISFPVLSGRDHGIRYAETPFSIGIMLFGLWTLLVPTTLAAGLLWRRSIAAGRVTIVRPLPIRVNRLSSSILTLIWSVLALRWLLLPISLLFIVPLLATAPSSYPTQVPMMYIIAVLMLGLPFLPLIWAHKKTPRQLVWSEAPVIPTTPTVLEEKHHPNAPHYLALARSMITVYAIMTLFFAALVPVCAAFERHYIESDHIMSPMCQGDDMGITEVEGQLVIRLRQGVRDGATTLRIPWK